MIDYDYNTLSTTAKDAMQGVPFVAGLITQEETPYYTKLLQAVVTFIVVGMVGWSASVVMNNRTSSELVLNQLVLINAKLEYMQLGVVENKADIKILKGQTGDRVYRPEWQQKYQEQDSRLLHLERTIK